MGKILLKMENQEKITLFQEQHIRRVWHNEAWWFSVIDVIEALTGTNRARKYWNDLKKKLHTEGYVELSENIGQLKMLSSDGKSYKTDAATSQTILRLIMSISSSKVEPFKHWLAQVGTERIEETENPELGYERLSAIYKAKGYSDEWIKNRLQTIETRKQLTDEWQKRGIKEGHEYSILTATIARETFGLTPKEHAELKDLKKQNLRDHMTPFELIFTALSEEATRALAVEKDAQGFEDNQEAAQRGGTAAGNARRNFEKETGLKVVSSENYLKQLGEKIPTE